MPDPKALSEDRVVLTQRDGFCFEIDFGVGKAVWVADERPPLGAGQGPTPNQLLVAAVGNCLGDSLHFALRKFNPVSPRLRVEGRSEIARNEAGRLRIAALHIRLQLGNGAAELAHLDRTLAQFESFCTVGMSVAQGIPLFVTVVDRDGQLLKAPESTKAQH